MLAAIAGLVVCALAAAVAAAFLTSKRPHGLAAPAVRPAVEATGSSAEPPAPPAGAVVLAREAGSYAVALAVQPGRLTATVLSPSGGGANGLDVTFAAGGRTLRGESCGSGCYRAELATRGGIVRVSVGRRTARFELPRVPRPAQTFVRHATQVFSNLRSVVYREHLASSPTLAIDTLWQLEAPNKLTYAIRGGSDAVVIGTRRWDRAHGGRWQRSTTTALALPAAPWGTRIVDAHVLSRDGNTVVVSWADPEIPAWFTARFDARTFLPRTLSMTAAAHFMLHRYISFNRSLPIRPPRTTARSPANG